VIGDLRSEVRGLEATRLSALLEVVLEKRRRLQALIV
jgi:hypothetical protein